MIGWPPMDRRYELALDAVRRKILEMTNPKLYCGADQDTVHAVLMIVEGEIARARHEVKRDEHIRQNGSDEGFDYVPWLQDSMRKR